VSIYLHNTCGFYFEDIFTPYTHVRLVLSVVKCTKRIVSGENQTERNVIATGARVQRIVFLSSATFCSDTFLSTSYVSTSTRHDNSASQPAYHVFSINNPSTRGALIVCADKPKTVHSAISLSCSSTLYILRCIRT